MTRCDKTCCSIWCSIVPPNPWGGKYLSEDHFKTSRERKKTEKRKSSSDMYHSVCLNYENPTCKNIIISMSAEDFKFPTVLEKAPILVLICCYQSLWKKSCHKLTEMKLRDPNADRRREKKLKTVSVIKILSPAPWWSLVTRTSLMYQSGYEKNCVCVSVCFDAPITITCHNGAERLPVYLLINAASCQTHTHTFILLPPLVRPMQTL